MKLEEINDILRKDAKVKAQSEELEEAVRNTDKAYYRLLGTGVITFTLGMCWIALLINIRGF